MKKTYIEPQITIVDLKENDVLLFSNPEAKTGALNEFNWNNLIK